MEVGITIKLMEAFRALPQPVQLRPTFMEIAGYPHFENVCSNILAFFLDPSSPHGLDALCLDALLEVAGHSPGTPPLSNVQVEREVAAGSGRLDIVIYSDTLVIAIENKLFASLDNPLLDYARHVEGMAAGQRKILKLVLSLVPLPAEIDYGFKGLYYKDFFCIMRLKLACYKNNTSDQYLVYLTDFLDTIDNLQKETKMDVFWLDFSREHCEHIERLLTQVNTLKDELRGKTQELLTSMNPVEFSNVKTPFLWRDKTKLSDILAYDIVAGLNSTVVVDTIISPGGWEIRVGLRGNKQNAPEALCKLLDCAGLTYTKNGPNLILSEKFSYECLIATVQSRLQIIIKIIAESCE